MDLQAAIDAYHAEFEHDGPRIVGEIGQPDLITRAVLYKMLNPRLNIVAFRALLAVTGPIINESASPLTNCLYHALHYENYEVEHVHAFLQHPLIDLPALDRTAPLITAAYDVDKQDCLWDAILRLEPPYDFATRNYKITGPQEVTFYDSKGPPQFRQIQWNPKSAHFALLRDYKLDPGLTRLSYRLMADPRPDFDTTRAVLWYAAVVLLCDDYFSPACEGSLARFLRIAMRLPMDMQIVLCNRLWGRSRDVFASTLVNKAFGWWLRAGA